MREYEIYSLLLALIFLASPITALSLVYISAPYGRHFRQSWKPQINGKAGWILMESAAILSFDAAYFLGDWASRPVSLIFLILWNAHYLDRAFLFPMRLSSSSKNIPVFIVATGFFFNLVNGYLNGRFLSFGNPYTADWLLDSPVYPWNPSFCNRFYIQPICRSYPDQTAKTRRHRISNSTGFFDEYISCPNYFGEVIEWFGWALADVVPAGPCLCAIYSIELDAACILTPQMVSGAICQLSQ